MCQRLSRSPHSLEPHCPSAAVMRSSAIVGHVPHTRLSLAAGSSFPEREESPMSRSLGGIQLSLLVQRHNRSYTYVRMGVTNVRAHTRVAGWGGV